MSKRILPLVLAVVLAFGVPVGVSAATASVFDGYKVAVLDTTTLATSMWGRTNDPNTMCFVAANGTELGSISYTSYNAIINANKVLTQLPDGSTLHNPPNGYATWSEWFATNFNTYRGLSSAGMSDAVTAHNNETVEQYRQDVIRLINAEREKAGLPAYIVHDEVMAYSQVRAAELVEKFSHTRPDGTSAGYEVIGTAASPQSVVNAWMESPNHKAAILNDARTYIGAGVYMTSTGGLFFEAYFELDPDEYPTAQILG